MLAYLPAAGCRFGWTSRVPARLVALVAAGFLLASCTRVEIEDHSLQYNEATGSLGNRVMLLNLLRAAKGYPMQFSRVNSYTGQSRMDGNLNLTLPFILNTFGNPSPARIQGTVTPSAQFRTGVSNLQLQDLNTAEIQEKLRRQVKASDFVYYRSQGWPQALVNTILIESLLVHPDFYGALEIASNQECSDKELDNGRKEVCRWLGRKNSGGCDPKEEGTAPNGDNLYLLRNNPRKHCEYERFQQFFAWLRTIRRLSLDRESHVNPDRDCEDETVWFDPKHPDRAKQAKARAKNGKVEKEISKDGVGDESKRASESVKDGKVAVDIAVNVKISDKGDKGKDDDASDSSKDQAIYLNIPKKYAATHRPKQLKKGQRPDDHLRRAHKDQQAARGKGIPRLRNVYACLLATNKTPMIILWRSPERMVRYLGEVVAVQAFGAGSKSGQIQILNDDGHAVDLLRVERGAGLLAGRAAVSVEGPERESFFIPVPEHHSRSAHLSLRALALVMEAFNQAVSNKALPPPATIILPGG